MSQQIHNQLDSLHESLWKRNVRELAKPERRSVCYIERGEEEPSFTFVIARA